MPYKDPDFAREYRRKYYQGRRDSDPEYSRDMQQSWREKNPRRYMLTRAKIRAKIEECAFELEDDDIVIPEYCPVYPHIKLEFCRGRGARPDNIPTLDKIVPALGYIPGNVAVISMRANRLKSDASPEELEAIAKWIRENRMVN